MDREEFEILYQKYEEGALTLEEEKRMEPYRVKRAIFMAAGFGSRMKPVTLHTPKPLVTVGGERIIDRLIDACLAAGIGEIYVVRGYLKEQFDELLEKYPMIRFVDNPMYDKANNISSIYCVRDLLENAYVFEADLYIRNPGMIKPYHYSSDFIAFYTDETDDWCFDVRDGVICEEKVGGRECCQMVGISYWSREDGRRLGEDVAEAFDGGDMQLYWEQVPLVKYKDRYKVSVQECSPEDFREIDTFEELCEMDASYRDIKWD